MKEITNLESILKSGNPTLIAKKLNGDTIECYFGRESEEYYLWQQNEEEKERKENEYAVPGRTESPRVDRGMLVSWIREFHKINKIKLPKRFFRKDYKELLEVYQGVLKKYGITEERILPQRCH